MKTKPSVVADYNVHMIEVDGMDQLTSYYSFTHKTVKWWRKVFFWMVEVALVNTYIIHKKLQQSIEMPAKSHITLRREILIELCKPLMQLPKPPRRISSDHSLERLQNKQHFSEKHPSVDGFIDQIVDLLVMHVHVRSINYPCLIYL